MISFSFAVFFKMLILVFGLFLIVALVYGVPFAVMEITDNILLRYTKLHYNETENISFIAGLLSIIFLITICCTVFVSSVRSNHVTSHYNQDLKMCEVEGE